MRILLVTSSYPPLPGGLEHHVATLAKELSRRGHSVVVATPRVHSLPAEECSDGVRVLRLANAFRFFGTLYRESQRLVHPPLPDPALMTGLRRLVQEFKPHIVHSHGNSFYSVAFIKGWLGFPLVYTAHNYGLICQKGTLTLPDLKLCHRPGTLRCIRCHASEGALSLWSLARSIASFSGFVFSRPLVPRADHYVAVSDFVRNTHINYLRLPPEKVSTIPNFLDPVDPGAPSSENQFPLPENFVLSVLTFTPNKGGETLLQAYKEVRSDCRLVILGIGPGGKDDGFQQDNRIVVYRNVPHAWVMLAWKRCRFGIVPSRWPEPCPTVAFEAMASKKALVASSVGGLADLVVTGQSGLLVPPGDPGALAKAIQTLLDDPALATEMGKQGHTLLERRYAKELVVDMIEGLYRRLVKASLGGESPSENGVSCSRGPSR